MTHQPKRELRPFINLWPFMQWGLDIVRLLPKAFGQRQYILVAIGLIH